MMRTIGLALLGMAMTTTTATMAQAPARPADDVARDAARKPDAMVAFAGIRPGDRVADLIPGGGYFTRVFVRAVGPKGVVYALAPASYAKEHPESLTVLRTLAAAPGYGNVRVVAWMADTALPEPVDVVWTAQNYHDLHNAAPDAVGKVNRAVFAMLKPGGTYVVLDHAAEPGSGTRDTNTLHRIDPATVKAEVTAAGFVYEGESRVLRNAADPHKAVVFDPAIRGRTDQFIFRFRKPR